MLTQLLQERELQDLLLGYLQKTRHSRPESFRYGIQDGTECKSLASGHHPQLKGPESWTTASVYHFAHVLDRLLAEAVRRELFRYLDTPLQRSIAGGTKKEDFATDFLDSTVSVDGVDHSLRDFLWDHFVQPLSIDTSIAEGYPR